MQRFGGGGLSGSLSALFTKTNVVAIIGKTGLMEIAGHLRGLANHV